MESDGLFSFHFCCQEEMPSPAGSVSDTAGGREKGVEIPILRQFWKFPDVGGECCWLQPAFQMLGLEPGSPHVCWGCAEDISEKACPGLLLGPSKGKAGRGWGW